MSILDSPFLPLGNLFRGFVLIRRAVELPVEVELELSLDVLTGLSCVTLSTPAIICYLLGWDLEASRWFAEEPDCAGAASRAKPRLCVECWKMVPVYQQQLLRGYYAEIVDALRTRTYLHRNVPRSLHQVRRQTTWRSICHRKLWGWPLPTDTRVISDELIARHLF